MNSDSENFDSLRQLLALKRHEVPPPGYFDRLPRDIMARIKAGDTGNELGADLSWFHRLLSVFDVKPVFAGAFGTAVCAFLAIGFVTSEKSPAFAAGAAAPGGPTFAALPTAAPSADDPFTSSSNGMPVGRSLFDQVSLHATPVSDRYYLPTVGN